MPKYYYRAMDDSGQEFTGSIDASSANAAVLLIRQEGRFVFSIHGPRTENTKVKTPGLDDEKQAWSWSRWIPVRRAPQLYFAEALSQLIESGIEQSAAVAVAGRVNSSFWFRRCLHDMVPHFRDGNSLACSLERTGAWVSRGLLSTLRVGEQRGNLAGELSAFAHRGIPEIGSRLAASLRPAASNQFAFAMARLLATHRITVGVIADAAAMVEGGYRFRRGLAGIVNDIESGHSLSEALAHCPRFFDPLFRACVDASQDRSQLQSTLKRLSGRSA